MERRVSSVHTLAVEQVSARRHNFIFQVQWSDPDGNNVGMSTARHDYNALYAFHVALLEREPEAAGALDTPRVVPPFPGKKKKVVTGLTANARTRAEHALAEKRLPEVAQYFQGIMKLPEIVESREFLALWDVRAAAEATSAATHGRDADACVFVGFLRKQGGGHKSWKRRHFLLDNLGRLFYYRDEQIEVPTGSLDLGDADRCCAAATGSGLGVDIPSGGWPSSSSSSSPASGGVAGAGAANADIDAVNDCGFAIIMPNRIFFCLAESRAEAKAWVSAICNGIEVGRLRQEEEAKNAGVALSGVLTKQGGSVKSWTQRFCTLSPTGEFCYYTAADMKTLKGTLYVDAITEVRGGGGSGGDGNIPPYGWPEKSDGKITGFSVHTAARTYYFYAVSTEAALRWRQALTDAWRTHQERSAATMRRATLSKDMSRVDIGKNGGPTAEAEAEAEAGTGAEAGNGAETEGSVPEQEGASEERFADMSKAELGGVAVEDDMTQQMERTQMTNEELVAAYPPPPPRSAAAATLVPSSSSDSLNKQVSETADEA